ncbi:MAG TPA: sulfotransferase [Candidatus Limnocylindrales bacterium]|nr:sulfotransferase [Candidatus Limnocylindrales bacterium]
MSDENPDGVFVISSGRCGSTLLSNLLALDPAVLSLQELMIVLQQDGLGLETVTGKRFWELLSRPSDNVGTLLRIGVQPPELRYEGDRRAPGYDGNAIPRLLAFALPAITDEPETLFDELSAVVPGFAEQPLPDHYRQLFAWLARRTGRTRWVERSGGSSSFAPALARMFPRARFIHLNRDIADTALSMSRHPAYQLIEIRAMFVRRCGADPYRSPAPVLRRPVPPELRPVLPEHLTPETLADRGNRLTNFVLMAAFMTRQAQAALAKLPPEQVVHLRYEDLVSDPHNVLTRLAVELDLPGGAAWAARAATRVARPSPSLPPDDPRREEINELFGRVAGHAG